MSHMPFPVRQLGLTIVELLVALVLSLLLLTGIVQVFLASKQTYATNEAMSVLQENGRFALEFVARSVRMGGYLEPISTLTRPLGVQGVACTSLCSENGAGNASDQLAVAFQPPRDPTTGLRYDCAGKTVNNGPVLVNVFSVQNGSLRCSSYEQDPYKLLSQNIALVSGIDRLQVLYGINTQGDLDSVDQYVSADRVTGLNRWNQVLAVRVAVLANSLSPVNPAPPARPYILLDAAPVSFDDRLARQVFTTTIQLKNTD